MSVFCHERQLLIEFGGNGSSLPVELSVNQPQAGSCPTLFIEESDNYTNTNRLTNRCDFNGAFHTDDASSSICVNVAVLRLWYKKQTCIVYLSTILKKRKVFIKL